VGEDGLKVGVVATPTRIPMITSVTVDGLCAWVRKGENPPMWVGKWFRVIKNGTIGSDVTYYLSYKKELTLSKFEIWTKTKILLLFKTNP